MKAAVMARRRAGVMFAPAPSIVRALWNEQPPAGSGQATGLDRASGRAASTAPRSWPRSPAAVSPRRWVPGMKYRHPFASVESSSAIHLAASSLLVGKIARAAGSSSQYYIASRFKALVGVSPSEWRRRG
jgi:hypothetical protein